ncbi:SDR family oxidoreductase [Paenalcaligenes niemegkensis]|uniref:SDR family oxidoreductase n=1 Tax=Paenalcaligenes niemegkensis TaxID=2895469 RepID=UPI001EE90D76|nr:SDR family oxidoreductase [Paenalcaligenes niemegkensis]MCQ9616324.1 SDR family oxidoreductase [Paenalcaligenes niemegkensis]
MDTKLLASDAQLIKPPSFDLHGQRALITGSTQGLGWAIAQVYAASGAHVILHGRNEQRLACRQRQLNEAGYPASFWQHDLSLVDEIENSFNTLAPTPSILVNAVGVRLRHGFSEVSSADIISHLQTNLSATVILSKLVAAKMARDGYGRIITLSSIAGSLARSGDAIYPIAKHGLEAMVRALAVEFGSDGITSNGIAPGTFATESNQLLASDPVNGPLVVGRNPLGRWAAPAEITGPALFLASTSSSYVNGHILVVDGGFSITF